jgi:hypothetical protein
MTNLAPIAVLVLAVPAATQDLAGSWKGRMEPQGHSAELQLDLRREAGAWSGALTFRAGPDGGELPIQELRVDGAGVLLRTTIEGADVRFELALEERILLGTALAREGERVLCEGPAGLARASDAEAQARLTRWLDARGEAVSPERRDAVIEAAADRVLSSYVFLDRAERAAADLRERRLRGEYDQVSTAARLAELLGRHLAESTRDEHVRVKHGSRRVPDPLAERAETPAELEQLRAEAEADGYGVGPARVLDGNVGLLEMRRFHRAELAGDALAAAMAKLSGADALILDLRACHGGDPVMVVLAASWFFEGRPRRWSDTVRRVDGTTTQQWTSAWLPGRRCAKQPLYVLTARRTFSAPEGLAYGLQQTGRATIVGETTGGGAHSGAWFPLDDRFAIFVPLSRSVNAISGGDWEGVGVEPDLPCAAEQALERAHRAALSTLGRTAGPR